MDSPVINEEEAGESGSEDGIGNKHISTDGKNSKDNSEHKEYTMEKDKELEKRNGNENNDMQLTSTEERLEDELPVTVETEEKLSTSGDKSEVERNENSFFAGSEKMKIGEETKTPDEETFEERNEVTTEENNATEQEDGNVLQNENPSTEPAEAKVGEKSDTADKEINEERDKSGSNGSITTATKKDTIEQEGENVQHENISSMGTENAEVTEKTDIPDEETNADTGKESITTSATKNNVEQEDGKFEREMSSTFLDKSNKSELIPEESEDNRDEKSDTVIGDGKDKNEKAEAVKERSMDKVQDRKSSQTSVLRGRAFNDKGSKSSQTSISKEVDVDQGDKDANAGDLEIVDEIDEGRKASQEFTISDESKDDEEGTSNKQYLQDGNLKNLEEDDKETGSKTSPEKSAQDEVQDDLKERTTDVDSERIDVQYEEISGDPDNGTGASNENQQGDDVKPEELKKKEHMETVEDAEPLKENVLNAQGKEENSHSDLENGEVDKKSSPRGETSRTSLRSTTTVGSEKNHTSGQMSSSRGSTKRKTSINLQKETVSEEPGHESDENKDSGEGGADNTESKAIERAPQEQDDGGGGDQETVVDNRDQNGNAAAANDSDENNESSTVDVVQFLGTYVLGPTLDELVIGLINVFGELYNKFASH